MFAPWTDKIGRKIGLVVNIAADDAAPSFLARCCFLFLELLDMGMIEGIRRARIVGKHFRFRHIGSKQHMGAQIDFLIHFAADIGIGTFCNVVQSVF